jgi:hypothetical protein
MNQVKLDAIDLQHIARLAHERAAFWPPTALAADAACRADTVNAQHVSAYFSSRARECLFALIGDGTGEA